jgi:hypothetical protein
MKKVSTAATKQTNNFWRAETDDRVGPGRSIELVLHVGWIRRSAAGTEVGDDSESHAGSGTDVQYSIQKKNRSGIRQFCRTHQSLLCPVNP